MVGVPIELRAQDPSLLEWQHTQDELDPVTYMTMAHYARVSCWSKDFKKHKFCETCSNLTAHNLSYSYSQLLYSTLSSSDSQQLCCQLLLLSATLTLSYSTLLSAPPTLSNSAVSYSYSQLLLLSATLALSYSCSQLLLITLSCSSHSCLTQTKGEA